jgi:hypothetical protein
MADRKISDLTALTAPAAGDYLPIVDISEVAAASKNKRITIEELFRGVPLGTAAAPSIAIEGDENTGIYSPGADQLAISTGGTGRLFVDASGRVGIGTSSPNYELHVNASDATNFIQLTNSGTGTGASDGFLFYNNGVNATISNQESGYLALETAGLERLRITSAGLVGLGTSAPDTILHTAVSQAGSAAVNIFKAQATNTTNNVITRLDLSAEPALGTASVLRFSAITGNAADSSNMAFNIRNAGASTEVLRISSLGRVGIGTTAPQHRLQVSGGSLCVDGFSDSANAYISLREGFSPSAAGGSGFRAIDHSGANADGLGCYGADGISFYTFATERARIDSSGRLLVGTSASRNVGSTVGRIVQIEGTSATTTGLTITRNSADTTGTVITLGKSRSASNGGSTVLLANDSVGALQFAGADGTDLETVAASISCDVDGTPGSNDMPGRLVFSTTADGSATPTERMRIDSSGKLLVGTSSARANFFNSTSSTGLQLEGAGNTRRISVVGNSGTATVILGRENSGAVGGNTLVSADNAVGAISFQGNDGTEFVEAGRIECLIDGTPGADDMPGRLVFSTTADGAASPTERMRITNGGASAFYCDSGVDTLYASSAAASGTSRYLFIGKHSATGTITTGTNAILITTNGNVTNINGSYGTISDAKLKENVTDAASQWDDLKAIRIRNWNFKLETGHGVHRQIGPIAQELEQVCPGLVFETPDRDEAGNETGEVTKGVNQSVLYMKAVKALQEAMERIEALEAKVAALEGA